MTQATTAAGRAKRPSTPPALPVWVIATVSVVFGLFYAYAVWAAIGFLARQAGGSQGLNGQGWLVLSLAIVFPLIAFGLAFALGWKRRILPFALILLTGLGVVGVFWINIVAYAAVYGRQLLGGA